MKHLGTGEEAAVLGDVEDAIGRAARLVVDDFDGKIEDPR